MSTARVTKGIYTVTELVEIGYPKQMLRHLLHSEDFSTFGFRLTPAVNSKAYINREKLDRYLEHRMDDHNGIIL